MSHIPPYGPGAPPPPPYYGYQNMPPPPPIAPGYTYVPAPVVMPMPIPYPQQPQPPPPPPTYVTNHYYPPPPPPPPPQPDTATVVNNAVQAINSDLRQISSWAKRLLANPKQSQALVIENPPVSPVAHAHVHEQIEFVPCTASTAPSYSHRAVVAGKEGWDGSPLWVIRAHYSGDLVPGKLAVKHRSAYIPHEGREIPVHNFELLCAPVHLVRWLPSSNGQVPVGAIAAGNTHKGEILYVGRVKHMKSITPGKVYCMSEWRVCPTVHSITLRSHHGLIDFRVRGIVRFVLIPSGYLDLDHSATYWVQLKLRTIQVHPTHGCLYISFGGNEIAHKSYEVLCKIVD